MVMPNQARGWLAHIQFQALGKKTFVGCAYWAVITTAVMLPVAIPVSLACLVSQGPLGSFLRVEMENVNANSIQGADYAKLRAAMNNPKKGEPLPTMDEKDPRYEIKPLPWKNIIIPGIGLVISQMMFGFSAVFAMRANGLLAFYFKKHMKLDSMARDVVWVDKKKLLENETPEQKKARKQKEAITNSVAVVAFIAVVGGVGWYVYRQSTAPPVVPAGEAAPAGAPGGAAPGAGAMPGGAMPGGNVPGGLPMQPGAGAAAGGVVIPN
jgi:hypothetical protein